MIVFGDITHFVCGDILRKKEQNDVGAVRLMMYRLRRNDNEVSAKGGYEVMAMPL